jgi:hypothetical protein
MRRMTILGAAMFGISTVAAVAQMPPAQNSTTGARPGHEIGFGDSLPRSDKASNITSRDTRSAVAPTLPRSMVGENATTVDYLRSARASLAAGHTGATRQSLEMAETRALDRSVAPGETDRPSDSKLVGTIRDARHAVGNGDHQNAMHLIDLALSS